MPAVILVSAFLIIFVCDFIKKQVYNYISNVWHELAYLPLGVPRVSCPWYFCLVLIYFEVLFIYFICYVLFVWSVGWCCNFKRETRLFLLWCVVFLSRLHHFGLVHVVLGCHAWLPSTCCFQSRIHNLFRVPGTDKFCAKFVKCEILNVSSWVIILVSAQAVSRIVLS